jgi:hypothetical protein
MKYRFQFARFYWQLVVLLGVLAGQSWGQTRPTQPLGPHARLIQTAVVPVVGVSQADLLQRARAWAQQVTPAGQVPVLSSGSDAEVVRTTGVCPFAYARSDQSGKTNQAVLRYTATLSVRAGRYQYEVTDFVFVTPGAGRYPAAEMPAEAYYNGRITALNEAGTRNQLTLRACFTEITGEVLTHLKDSMYQPAPKMGNE